MSHDHTLSDDPFVDSDGNPRIIRGVSVISNSTRLAELVGKVGLEAVWIEGEHGTPSWSEVEVLCLAAEAGGAYPTVRTPDQERTSILRTLETGARILAIPMVNTADQARQVVQHAKFPPMGQRGFNVRSRGGGYGLDPPLVTFEKANKRTHIFVQIEMVEGIENLEEICQVEGISGVMMGPGDLSADMGKTAQFTDPELIDMVLSSIRHARKVGLNAGIFFAPGKLMEDAVEAGANLLFYGGDVTDLAKAWRGLSELYGG